MRLCLVIVFLISSCKALSKFSTPSSTLANCLRVSATAVLRTIFGVETDADEPSIRNSNLLPVNANGEVRFLSVVSLGNFGRVCTPIRISSFSFAP